MCDIEKVSLNIHYRIEHQVNPTLANPLSNFPDPTVEVNPTAITLGETELCIEEYNALNFSTLSTLEPRIVTRSEMLLEEKPNETDKLIYNLYYKGQMKTIIMADHWYGKPREPQTVHITAVGTNEKQTAPIVYSYATATFTGLTPGSDNSDRLEFTFTEALNRFQGRDMRFYPSYPFVLFPNGEQSLGWYFDLYAMKIGKSQSFRRPPNLDQIPDYLNVNRGSSLDYFYHPLPVRL